MLETGNKQLISNYFSKNILNLKLLLEKSTFEFIQLLK